MRPALFALALLSGCGSDDDGVAPAIAALTFSPTTATHGVPVTVTGTFTFTDDDGDLAELGAEVTLPDQSKQTLPMTDLQNVGDMTSGTLNFQMQLIPPAAGTYQFALWITDDADRESNRLGGTITAN